MYQALIRFLHTLGIPIVAIIRDSQNYVRAAELGIGVHEMKSYVAQQDIEQWGPLVTWLTGTPDSTLSPRGAPPGGARQPEDGAQAAEQPAEAAAPAAEADGATPPEPALPEAAAEEAVAEEMPAHAVAAQVG
jgi:hypothetical protein